MKKMLLSLALFLMGTACFSQEERNGDIYIKHPYIEIVNNTNKAYMAKDGAAYSKYYSDTAKFWVSGMKKDVSIPDALKMWSLDFGYYDSVTIRAVGYPDYLAYKDHDQKVVQSWGIWSGKSKKTGAVLKVDYVQFDGFNKDGKIIFESLYGDFSQLGSN
jgi:hypothetical protein